MLRGFELIRAYINYLLIITKGDWSGHLEKLELPLQKLKDKRLKCNIKRSFLGQTEMEYLGFWVPWKGIQPRNKKLEAIINMISPTSTKQVRTFIGLVNYYRDMWARRAHLLQPLTSLTSSKLSF